MRINVYTNEGVLERARNIPGSKLEGYLQLVSDPVVQTDAATKRYVDEHFAQISIDDITTGSFSESSLPAMSGDAVSTPGSNIVNLKPITTAGSYVNLSVNEKGLVTGSNPITQSQLFDLEWVKVEADHPTDTIGYGIKDAITTSGGNIDVNITLSGNPTESTHAATKKYVEITALSGGSSGLSIGDIILKYNAETPTGFLHCNGAEVSKTTYSNLYAVLTAGYDEHIVLGGGKPWEQQYGFNPSTGITFNNPSSKENLATTAAYAQAAVTKNKIYLFGGASGSGVLNNTVQTAAIDASGNIGAWSNSTLTMPSAMSNFQVAVTNNFLYLFAGVSTGNSTNFIYRTPIDSNGDLGAWQTAGTLPQGVSGHQVVLTTTRVYVIGGSIDGGVTATDKVHYAPIAEDGTIGTWVAGPSLPFTLQHTRVAVTKGRVYLIGGHTGSTVVPNLIYGAVDTTGAIDEWVATTVLPGSVSSGNTIVTDNHVYYMGGTNANNLSGASGNIYKAPIAADGSIGTWELATGTFEVKGASVVFLPGGVFAMGGVNKDGTYLNTTTLFVNNGNTVSADLSYYYSPDVVLSSSKTTFRLPDLNIDPSTNMKYYIKF